MALLYADENFDYPIVEELRRLGHDVVTVQEAGQQGKDDAAVLAFATAAGRAVLTFNRRDFFRLHRLNPAHAGIIACTTDNNYAALAGRIDAAITRAGALSGKVIRVNRPPTP
jgi:predicted nuclease of predicted toxin-antitoxin system